LDLGDTSAIPIKSSLVAEVDHSEPSVPNGVRFLDACAASQDLARIRKRTSPSVYEFFVGLLSTAPNPDASVNLFDRLAESNSGDLMRLFNQHPSLIHYAVAVFGHSPWLGETLIQNQDLFYSFARERRLDRSHSRDEFEENFARMRSRSFETDSAALLARFKRREYVRIMLRDVLGIATMAETTAEISALSDVLIEDALREAQSQLQRRFGTPQHLDQRGRVVDSRFSVLSLGKLGGNELNYSSDIDLLYLYDGGEEPAGSEISNREYFVRLAQNVTELLSRHTPEGPVFRIDLRLRPQGGEGEPAVPLAHAIHYYSHVAHDWELQAMIKARHSAGDVALAREFVRAVQPYVYRPELNFAAIRTALETRARIGSQRRKGLLKQVPQTGIDVKVDRGGIRDIEFLVQCLQRVYGGGESWLRSRGTLFALQKLRDKEHISSKDFHNLTNAYEFLRNLEHRLQLCQGQQTHRLPQAGDELNRLARSMVREGTGASTPEEFIAHVQRRMAAVQEIYQRVILQEQNQDPGAAEFQLQPEVAATPDSTHSQIMQRLAIDSPYLRELASRPEISQHARRNLDRFLSSAGTTSERYGAVLRSPTALERAMTAFEYSEFLTDILVRHPEEVSLLDTIAEASRREGHDDLFSAELGGVAAVPDPVFGYVAQAELDRGEAMAVLRQQYRRRVFLCGAEDLFRPRQVFETLYENTAAADAAISAALAISGSSSGFAVLSLGRLGTREFDLLSDADLLFVCDNHSNRPVVGRLAEQFMEALTAYTKDGTVFPVDARLRPHGREGELIVTPTQLQAYFAYEAKPWEALTYLKLRYVAGDRELADRILKVVQDGIAAMAHRSGFDDELREVRTKLEKSESGHNFKTGAGGSYDLDYLAGVLQAKHQLWFAGNLCERLRRLRDRDLLQAQDYEILARNARFLRTIEHGVRLVTGRARKWLPVAEHPRRAVRKVVWPMLDDNERFDLEMRLHEVLRQTRTVCATYLPASVQ
jgi:glutamate-ammonia-ligase adenylyltransferase